MSLRHSPEDDSNPSKDDSNPPKSGPKNHFEEYLKTRTPEILDPPGAEASAEAITAYEKDIVHLFLILVKRSIFLTLENDEKKVVGTIIDLIDGLPGDQRPDYKTLRSFATIACTSRWQDPERTNSLFVGFLDDEDISVFGEDNDDADTEDSSSESSDDETDDESVAKRIAKYLPPLTEPSDRPQVPDFSKDGTLDHYSNEIQDKFFFLTKTGDLTINETWELMYYYVMLQLVDHSGPNHENYSILYNNCIDVAPSLVADDINDSYQPWAERGYNSTNPSLRRTFYVDLLRWRCLSDLEKGEIKALGSNPHGKAMDTISDDEDEDKMANEMWLPPLPNLPKGMSQVECYNTQQKLELDAWAVLMRAIHRPLNPKEVKYLDNLVKLLGGHLSKAKKAKLNEVEMMQLRAMAGNGKPGEGTDEVDGDIEMHDVERADEKTTLPFLELVIKTLGTQAESCGAVLTMIQEHTMDSIDV
ncbi:hypothetical protein B0H14DRAFT_3471299 [Mycena olivaceomarginata]|nr:hypothetical protein B0H14DRAFT_3471299 [Mycena olivaceomarginata]